MTDFEKWIKNNEASLNLLTRQELAQHAWDAATAKPAELQPIHFNGRVITDYTLETQITFEKSQGFNLYESEPLTESHTQAELQALLNQTQTISILHWLLLSQNIDCPLEFSAGDKLDFSESIGQPDSVISCKHAFLGVIKYSEHFIEVCKIVDTTEIS